MSNAIPVGHYSQLGEQTINRIANDDIEFMNFMKYFGRVFKHPVSVALEFYANRPEAQFIASATQWKTAGFQLKPASKGIQFLDNSGKAITLYDFDDVIGEYPPKRWTITNKNVDAVREKLELPKNEPFFAALDTSSASAIDDLSLIQELELNSLTNEEKLKFRNSYHGMIQTMIAGRLEINGARYSVQPDRAALQFCKTSEQRLLLLSSAASAARKALNSVEYAFDTIRTEIAQRKDEVKNDVRTVESAQRGTENASTGNRLSSDSERGTGERSDRVQTGEEGQSARMDDSSEGRRTDQSDVAAGSNDRNDNIGERDDRAAVPSESLRRTVRSVDTERTVDGGTADRTVRSDVDGEHGEELPREGRNDDVPSQLSDGSTVGSGKSSSVQGAADGTVRQAESSSAHDGLQHTSRMDNSEEVSDRPLGNDGDSSSSSDNSLNTEHLNDLIFRVSHFYSVNNAVLNSDKETAIFEIKNCCQKMLPYMLAENLNNDTFAEFHNAISDKFASDTAYFDSLAEQIYTDVASKITENDRISANWKNVDVFIDNGDESIDWVYYNPDSSEGGQLVVNHLTHEQLLDSTRFEDNYNYLQSVARQELIDISAVDFADTANYYLNLANNTDALFVCRTGNMKEIQLFLNDYIKKLENPTTDNYTEYRNNLKESRFTALSNAQKFKYAHTPYVEEPESSIWGEVDHVYRINNGIFEVATPSHGGIMIESNIARAILSPEAQNVAQKERGWYYFEEDCDYAVAKRELLDKGLFSDIDDYFSSQYSQKTNDFFTSYSNSINDSIQHWNDTYWNSREAALSNTSASDVSSIIDDIKVDLEETREIRQREIRKAMDDAQRRIDRIKEASGDPNDLAAQENVLNFLKAASEENIELTTENFNAFVAEHGVATNSNDGSNSYFEIYQLKNNAELRYHRFTDYETLKREGNVVESKNYNQVYRDVLESGTKLDDIYYRFNMEHPDDFKGHSLSVSDIIVVHDNGDTAAYYVDSFGFKKVPEFLQLEQENNIVRDFRKRTAQLFHPMDYWKPDDIEGFVGEHVIDILRDNGVKFNEESIRVVLNGSRARGLERPDSDVDVVVEIDTDEREDSLFNLLNTEPLMFPTQRYQQIRIDINPITPYETGTLETYLPRAEAYLIEKANNVNTSDNEQAIHSAFAAIYAKHNYSAKQKQFLERLEKFAAKNNITEKIVDTAFEKSAAFHNTYGNREFVSKNIFGRRLGSTEKELIAEIQRNIANAAEAPVIEPAQNSVELHETERNFDTPLDRAKYLINSYCESEFDEEANFDDMHNIGLAHTTLTDYQLPVQVTADLIDYKITYEFSNEVYKVEQYTDIEDMVENGLSGLDFDDLVDVPEELIERHVREMDNDNSEKYISVYKNKEPQLLVSAEINGEVFEYNMTGCTLDKIMQMAATEKPIIGFSNIGSRISSTEYAEIEQSERLSSSVSFDFDNDLMIIQTVNDGNGGVIDTDRNDSNYRIERFSISEYLSNLSNSEPTDAAEQSNASEVEALTDELNAQILHDVEVGDVLYMKEPQSGELMYFRVDSFTSNFMVNFSRVADAGGNSYDEIGFASFGIIDGHWRETILDANTDSPILRFTKQYQEDYKKQQSEAHESATLQPITINKYGLTIDFKKISSIELQEHQYNYKGGIDENGHERKDNFSESLNTISFYDIDDSNSVMRWDSTSYFGGDPVSLEDAAAEIEAFLDKATNDGNLAAFIKNTDGSRTYLDASNLLVSSANTEEFTTQEIYDILNNYNFIGENKKQDVVNYFQTNEDVASRAEYIHSIYNDDYSELDINGDRLGYKKQDEGLLIWKGSFLSANSKLLLTWNEVQEYTDNLINAGKFDDVATNSNDESIDILPISEEATVETAASETVQSSINAAPIPTGKPHRATRAEMLYREFVEAFPDIANGNHTHERYGAEYIEDGDNDAYEPLSLESLGDDTYSFMMWYVQNGDLMRDPDFVFTLDHESKELHVWEYQQDGVPFFGTVYESVTHEDGTVDRKLQASLEENFRNVLRNAVSVNRELSTYTDSKGEHELHEGTSETAAPETYAEPEITDSSAQYREVLNEFSEKHNLGELNLLPNSNGYHITEKYNDGISVPLYYIYSYSYKPLTPEELQKELNNWEETASRNNSTVEKDSHREPQIHGGTTELPPIPDNLPEIKYADNPRRKVDDNLTAINEMQKLESYESEGNFYPFEQGRNDYNSYDSSMARLRRYSGWGGVPQFFDERYEGFNYQRARLKELITEEEYASARSSTLNSHYTPQIIIDEMVKTIRNMGLPKDARILEPSCGTGNFISRIPRDMGKGGIIGIELDPVTAKIAKHLVVPKHNPYAKKEQAALEDTRDIKIMNCGFENSNLPNNSFDLVIGNVPFGEYKMHDPEYSKDLLIHDAFFRKALDKVAPGGVVAFITSSGTLDKKNPKIREQLAMKADLIGAVRLPNNAFSDAGTSVTSDVIFLQKRKTPLNAYDPKPDWCYTTPVDVEMVGKKYEGETRTAHINSYFVQNPQMVLGTMKQTTHFDMLTCEPLEGKSLKEQLDTAFRQLNAKISIEKRENDIAEKKGHIQPWGKAFTFQIKDDKVYYNRGTTMDECKDNEKNINKLKALCDLRDITRELLDKQQTHISDEELVPLRNKLNEAYDKFVKDNGNLTSRSIYNLFSDDSDYPILGALEDIDPETKKVTKAAIFTTRTVKPVVEVTSVATADEALQVSLDKRGKVDIPYMATLVENQFEDKQLNEIMEIVASELLNKGAVFRDPEKLAAGKPYSEIVDRAEYLCGDVRRKLAIAQDMANQDSNYAANVDALTEIIPEDIGAAEISADIGCAWIDTDDYEDFVRELSERSVYDSRKYAIHYSDLTGKFTVENARQTTKADYNQNETSTYGTEDMNLYLIMDNLLNQRKVQVFDRIPDPNNPKKYKSVLNKNKTQVAQSKAKLIKQKFSEWIFADESRKEKYVRRYNDRFNSIVGRTYDGSHLTFSGMANGFKLRPHQADCVARTIYGGNTLAAHCVGAGKSAVIAASVMKKKELGLINKACIVVPKPLTEQTEREWRASFPDAKLLVVDNKDLSIEKKRDIFAARASTGDYDAIIMSQEQFEKLPMSPEHQLEFLERRKAELLEHLEAKKLESRGRRDYSVKEIEALLKSLEVKIEAILNPTSKQKGKDTLLNFEALGFDYLVVDEAHAYKNGSVLTKMGDVSGVSTRESGRSADMQMKCDYFNSEFGNGHILFATGTPVSNSMTELYVMTRYMRPDLLENCGCSRFDDWAATFGNIKTQNKKTATGELKLKTCFAGFKNRPELIKMYKEFADLKTLDKLDYLHPPKIKGGKPQVVEVEATPEQREMVKGFAERGRAIQAGLVTPSEDNLLKITSEARIVGLGNRAVASIYRKNDWDLPDNFVEDDKTGKIDECVKRVAEIYKERYDEKAVQLIFSDIAVNSGDDKFSAYEYLREELIAKGVKPEEIIFAPKSDAKNRPEIFRDINEGKYRVVIASTGTLGTGANIQKNLYALHHLDIPWRPSDFEQREGRIVRQGNKNEEVEIFNYVTKGTLDSYLYQGVTDKARGIAQLWNDTCVSRTAEDIDEKVLTFGELEAAAEGNPKLRQYSELKNKIDEMQVVRAEYNRETTRVEKKIAALPETISARKSLIEAAKNDKETAKRIQSISIITDKGETISEKDKVNKFIFDKVQLRITSPLDNNPSFKIGDFEVSVATASDRMHPTIKIQGERSAAYYFEAGVGGNADNYQRLANFFASGIDKQIEKDTASMQKAETDLEQAKHRVSQPFPNEEEYQTTLKEFEELETELTKGGFLDNGEEIAGAEDYGEVETEHLENNNNDKDDLTPEEYNHTI